MMQEESSKIPKSMVTDTKTLGKNINLDNNDVSIQEISDNDNSSTGNLNYNQVEISEIESKIDSEINKISVKENDLNALSIQTFPFYTTEEEFPNLEESIIYHETNSSKNENFKIRRAKKRAALESHFSPYFFTPRYLDIIKEEGSDLNDVEKKSDLRETKSPKKTPKPCDNIENNLSTVENETFLKNVNVIFPKSNLDFSQKKKHISNIRTLKTGIIREEIPCYVFEAKIVEQIIPVEENCSTCINETIAHPDAAEVIYLESTSSSSSDIMDLDNIGADDDDTEDLNDDTDMKIMDINMNNDGRIYFRKSETPVIITDEIFGKNSNTKNVCNDSAIGNENKSCVNWEKNESTNIFDDDNIQPNTQIEISRDDAIIHDNYQTVQTKNNQCQKFRDQFCGNIIKNKSEINNNFDIASSLENNLNLAEVNQKESYEKNEFSNAENNQKIPKNVAVNTVNLDSQYEKRLLEIKKVASKCIQEIIDECEQKLNSQFEIENNFSEKTNIFTDKSINNSETGICDNMNVNISTKSFDEKSEIYNKQINECCISNEINLKHYVSSNEEIIRTDSNAIDQKCFEIDKDDKNTDVCTIQSFENYDFNQKKCEKLKNESDQEYNYEFCDIVNTSNNDKIMEKNNIIKKLVPSKQSQTNSTSGEKSESSLSNVNMISNENSTQNTLTTSNENDNVDHSENNTTEYSRQNSSGSYCSDHSHSTDHSLCTAINKGSSSHLDLDIEKYVSESSHYLSQKLVKNTSETISVKTLRQLCVEKLITMPYGNVVLEELALFAESLSDLTNKYQKEKQFKNISSHMPDSLQELPQINNLENSTSRSESNAKIKSFLYSDKLESSPPPVPELPADDIWFPVQIQKNLKTPPILPPSHCKCLKKTKSINEYTADHLSDMQKKFIERGGYHELIAQQINKNVLSSVSHSPNNDVTSSSVLSTQKAPTIPPPPLPRSSRSFNSENQITIDAENKDKNNHRLLAIIRDSKQPLVSENESRGKVEQVEKLPSELKTNNHYLRDQQPQRSEKIERNLEKQEISESTKLTETTIIKEEKMPFKIDGEEYHKFTDEDIFDTNRKKFFSMESTPYFCNQLRQTLPKRYSNIETSSYKTEKRIENGNVVYEYSDSSKEKVIDEDRKSDKQNETNQVPSGVNLNTNVWSNETINKNPDSVLFEKNGKESDVKRKTLADEFSYEEFRQRAKESAKKAQDEFLKRENFFKSYDDISKYFEDHIDENKFEKIFKEKNEETKIYSVPIKIDRRSSSEKQIFENNKIHEVETEQNHMKNNKNTYVIPIVVEEKQIYQPKKSTSVKAASDENIFNIPVILEENSKVIQDKNKKFCRTQSLCQDYNQNNKLQEKRRSAQNLNECMCCTDEFDASPKNITKPFQKEVEIIHKARQSNAKAPRLSVSTSNLATEPKIQDFYRPFSRIDHYNSSTSQPSIDQTPISCFIYPRFSKRSSLPGEIHNQELDRIKMKEMELKAEFEKLENERCRLVREMDLMTKSSLSKEHQRNLRPELSSYRSRNLSTSFEEETFQQMYNEWLNKVAEREERRLQKIIKISKPSSDITQLHDQSKQRKSSDISDEFLKRVKERRSKLHMPSDSDWESGAESQPATKNDDNDKILQNENVKVIEGQTEADLNRLPKHLREFVEFTNQIIDKENIEHHKIEEEKQNENKFASLTIKDDSSTTSSKVIKTKSIIKNHNISKNDDQGLIKESNHQQQQNQQQQEQNISEDNITAKINQCPTPPPQPSQPIWTPQPSPTTGRKEFRPIKFQSPNLPRRYVKQDSCPVPPPWVDTDSKSFPDYQKTSTSCRNLNKININDTNAFKTKINSNSTNSLVQRTKENLFGKGALYPEIERSKVPKDYTPPIAKPNEVVYSIKHEYMSEPESENDQPKKMAQLGRRQYEGIGPTTKDGMPIVLRSEVKENNQHKWYKRIYNTLHKAKDHGRYPYKSNGYMSEPETHYDSDYSTMKYHTIEKQNQHTSLPGRNYGSMPNPIKSAPSSYKNQPGRIEDYMPGHSSISENQRKHQMEQEQLSDNYTEGYLSRVLKQQGYESDSNLIFRKKKDSPTIPLSPVEQKQAYKSVQAGGEPPLHGFRKPAPEKSKDNNEIKYFPITSTLTKIRVLNKDALPQPQQEVICYPITNISRPLDLFASFPKNVPSFIPISQSPPPLPNRSSSRKNAALKIYSSHVKEYKKSPKTGGRHETCFQTAVYRKTSPTNKYDTITIRKHSKKEPIVHSKSADSVSKIFAASVNEEFIEKCGSHISRKQKSYLVSSTNQNKQKLNRTDLRKSSPSPVAFGRSISKERTFAEEKKRLEEVVPLCRRYFNASTNILRDPSLKSPNEVKKAVRNIVKPLIRTKSAPKEITSSTFLTLEKSKTSPAKSESKLISVTSRCDKDSQKTKNLSTRSSVKKSSAIKSIIQASKMIGKSSDRQLTKSSSTHSLIKTNSTFSIDSNGSKKKNTFKKPLTITHSMSKDHISSRTNNKGKIIKSSSKNNFMNKSENKVIENLRTEISKSQKAEKDFILKQAKSIEEEIKRDTNTAIMKHIDSVRTDDFFCNLFLKDLSSISPIQSSIQPGSVLEKAKYWNTISAKSEPSLRRSSFYLSQKRPVSDSKFLTIGNKRCYQSRSLSPTYRKSTTNNQKVFDQISKFNSFHQTSNDESEFEEQAGQTEKIIYKFEQKNNSESRNRKMLAEDTRANSLNVIHGRKSIKYSEVISPSCIIKSPSRRRIQSFKDNQKSETKKVIRAKSLSSADEISKRRLYDCNEHSHSTSSLNVIEGHSPHCSLYNSNRFRDLSKFYTNIEKVGQLERATSSTDLHPIRKEGEIIDFDEWKKIRAHERALKEMYYLVEKLKQDGKEKDFLYKSKYPEDFKWNETNDSALRCKEKSVEDLRETFEKKIFEDGFDEVKRFEIESKKDTYKSLWRGSSVMDTATNMVVKCNIKNIPEKNIDKRICLSKTLISTLTKDQLNKIKSQLSEIYSNGSSGFPKEKNEVLEDYIITVDEKSKDKVNSLKVRCNSSLSKDELLGSVLKREESASFTQSTNTLPAFQQTKSFRSSKQVGNKHLDKNELSENEKKILSQTLCKKVQDKLLERKKCTSSPVARETFGAVATESAKKSLPQIDSEQQIYSLEHSCTKVDESIKNGISGNASDVSKTALIYNKDNSEGVIQTKIKYFEEKKEEPPKTIYHARDYSSPDEEEVFKAIEEKFKTKERKAIEQLAFKHKELSSSLSDLKELFGEKEMTRINLSNSFPPFFPDERNRQDVTITASRNRSLSLTFSKDSPCTENLYRSRSISPIIGLHKTPAKFRSVNIKNIKNKFENFHKDHGNFFNLCPLRKLHSDPEITKSTSRHKVTVKDHETGDVLWIANKFEMKNLAATRGRSRACKRLSPIPKMPLRKEDRLMPHIDVISKTASLKAEMKKNSQISNSTQQEQPLHTGEVERIRCKFESPTQTSLLGQIYTSSPDISELKDISTYLTGDWIAHRFPNPRDNARSPISPERGPENKYVKRRTVHRPSSTSPPRSKSLVTSILKPYYDIFANQEFDPFIHRPKARYIPDNVKYIWENISNGNKKSSIVKFEESDAVVQPLSTVKGTLNENDQNSETFRRYFESDVNIHYKTPIRYEYKEPVPEEELARRQAETMKKLYQEERHRKYLQELQDVNKRRHTDNFTPSQKSPVPLNRYDDFVTNVAPKPSNASVYPRTVARALYNFQGQTAKELTFKKGDIIYIRRQIDKNWYEGEHNAMIGLLPANYIEIITKDGTKQPPKKSLEGQARAKFNFQAQSAIELSLNKGELVTLTRRVDENWFEGKIANRKGIFPVSYVEVLTDIGSEDNTQHQTHNKPIGIPVSHSLITYPNTTATSPSLDTLRTNIIDEFNNLTNDHSKNTILRETKSIHNTEVLHIDTNTEPIAYRALYKYRPQNNDELELQENDIVYVLEKCDDGWYVGTSQRTGCFGTFPGNYVERIYKDSLLK